MSDDELDYGGGCCPSCCHAPDLGVHDYCLPCETNPSCPRSVRRRSPDYMDHHLRRCRRDDPWEISHRKAVDRRIEADRPWLAHAQRQRILDGEDAFSSPPEKNDPPSEKHTAVPSEEKPVGGKEKRLSEKHEPGSKKHQPLPEKQEADSDKPKDKAEAKAKTSGKANVKASK